MQRGIAQLVKAANLSFWLGYDRHFPLYLLKLESLKNTEHVEHGPDYNEDAANLVEAMHIIAPSDFWASHQHTIDESFTFARRANQHKQANQDHYAAIEYFHSYQPRFTSNL